MLFVRRKMYENGYPVGRNYTIFQFIRCTFGTNTLIKPKIIDLYRSKT